VEGQLGFVRWSSAAPAPANLRDEAPSPGPAGGSVVGSFRRGGHLASSAAAAATTTAAGPLLPHHNPAPLLPSYPPALPTPALGPTGADG
jgi:hypothetical protein